MVAAFEIARVCAKSALIFPVALFVYTYALVTLPFHVLLALFRSLTGVGGRTVDELFSSIMLPGGVSANEADTALLRGLREKHNLAMATLRDQLDDSDSRYKVPPLPRPSARASLVVPPGARFPARRFKSAWSHLSHPPPSSSPRSSPSNPQTVYEKLRESERMRSRMQHRLTVAQEELILSGSRVPESPQTPEGAGRDGDGWGGKDRVVKDGGADDPDKIPVYVTTFMCVVALLYFYDVPEVPAFDRKLAMLAPGAWMTAVGTKHPAMHKILILCNLVFFGYLLHILVQHRRDTLGVGAAPSSALGGIH